MNIVKSYSVGDGDMYYISHGRIHFTVIDCNLVDADKKKKEAILNELKAASEGRSMRRFILTHPHDDHSHGIKDLFKAVSIKNFYGVDKTVLKEFDDIKEIISGCNFSEIHGHMCRRWLNKDSENKESAQIYFEWPDPENEEFIINLRLGHDEVLNDICPVITYRPTEKITFMWMGDLSKEMQQEYYDRTLYIPDNVILFAPHHGREEDNMPDGLLDLIDPKLVVIGNAASKDIDYAHYGRERTLAQNVTGDITFVQQGDEVWVYTERKVAERHIPKCLDRGSREISFQHFLQEDRLGHYLGRLKY